MKEQFIRSDRYRCHKLPLNDEIRKRLSKVSPDKLIEIEKEREIQFKPKLQHMINEHYRDEDPMWYVYINSVGKINYKLFHYNEEPSVPYITISAKNLIKYKDS